MKEIDITIILDDSEELIFNKLCDEFDEGIVVESIKENISDGIPPSATIRGMYNNRDELKEKIGEG